MTPAETAGHPARILLLGGTSEIGLAILTALGAPPETEILLAGRDEAALEAAGKTLPYQVRTFRYDATETAAHDDFIGDSDDGVAANVVVVDLSGRVVRQDSQALLDPRNVLR